MKLSLQSSWKGKRLAIFGVLTGLTHVDLHRWVFFVLSLLGLRQWLARIMPQSLIMSVGAGIGLFIA